MNTNMEMDIVKKMDASSWESWKKSLSSAVEFGEDLGISDEQISKFAVRLGDYLASNISPDVPENKSLKEMWSVADRDEQRAIASCMIKLVKNDKQ